MPSWEEREEEKYFWECEKCGSFVLPTETLLGNRRKGCPHCGGNSFFIHPWNTTVPRLAEIAEKLKEKRVPYR